VKNFRKSLKELIQVNPEAGYLRLFFSAVLAFILWSLLAIISAFFNPLGKLDLSKVLEFNSTNLAISLFRDLLKAYFSLFTIASLILLLSVFYISFKTLAEFYARLKSFSSTRISKNYLSNCAFSIPQTHKYLFPDDFTNASGDIPDGPFKAAVKPGYALLISSRKNYSVRFNDSDNSDNLEMSLGHQEKIIDCFNINPASISFKTEENSRSKSFLIELVYSFELPVEHKNINQFLKIFELSDSKIIREIIEKILVSEVKVSINQYFWDTAGLFSFSTDQTQKKITSDNSKMAGEFKQKTNGMFLNISSKFQKQVIKRNRKRPIYLSPAISTDAYPKNTDENLSPSLVDILNGSLTINLKNTMLNLFGADIIKAKILKINEQGTI
jgi:hypothetical protein